MHSADAQLLFGLEEASVVRDDHRHLKQVSLLYVRMLQAIQRSWLSFCKQGFPSERLAPFVLVATQRDCFTATNKRVTHRSKP